MTTKLPVTSYQLPVGRGVAAANTLIIAILLTTLFIFMTVGVMTLIVQSSLNVAALESATRANYAAESGVEIASLWLRDHQPGFEDTLANVKLGSALLSKVDIEARTKRLPKDETQEWNTPLLKLDAASIALFYDNSTYMAPPPPKVNSLKGAFTLSFSGKKGGTPQFQWTILDASGRPGKNESITGCFGAAPCDDPTMGIISSVTKGKLNNALGEIFDDTPISAFLADHEQCFLVIQNTSPDDVPLLWRMEYGGEWADDKFVVTATGTSGSYAQTQRAEIPLGEFLPFFHFAIFSPGG